MFCGLGTVLFESFKPVLPSPDNDYFPQVRCTSEVTSLVLIIDSQPQAHMQRIPKLSRTDVTEAVARFEERA